MHTCANESHVLRTTEVGKILGKVGVVPRLVSVNDLQRYMMQTAGKHAEVVALTYFQFEKLLKVIAHFSFPQVTEQDKFVYFLLFIRPGIEEHYKVHISMRGAKIHPMDTQLRTSKTRSSATFASSMRRSSQGTTPSRLTPTPTHTRTISSTEYLFNPSIYPKTTKATKDKIRYSVTISPALFGDSVASQVRYTLPDDWMQPL